jgi:hypothetical protein
MWASERHAAIRPNKPPILTVNLRLTLGIMQD